MEERKQGKKERRKELTKGEENERRRWGVSTKRGEKAIKIII